MVVVRRYALPHQDQDGVVVDLVSRYLVMVFPVQVSFSILLYIYKHLVKTYLLLPHVERLAVTIFVDYTHPDDFSGGPNEYRAASGPVTVTCTATGAGSGTISYRWSSTCRSCPFQTATSRVVARAAVLSGDTGTHTCVATRGGSTASASVRFNIVGKLKPAMEFSCTN